jgi:hypothetical protein
MNLSKLCLLRGFLVELLVPAVAAASGTRPVFSQDPKSRQSQVHCTHTLMHLCAGRTTLQRAIL